MQKSKSVSNLAWKFVASAAALVVAGAVQAQGQRQLVEELLREDAEMALNDGKKPEPAPVASLQPPAGAAPAIAKPVAPPPDVIAVSRILGLSSSEEDRRTVDLFINGQREHLAIGDVARSWRLIDISGKCVTLQQVPPKAKSKSVRARGSQRARKPRVECIEFAQPVATANLATQVQGFPGNAIAVPPMPSPMYRAPAMAPGAMPQAAAQPH